MVGSVLCQIFMDHRSGHEIALGGSLLGHGGIRIVEKAQLYLSDQIRIQPILAPYAANGAVGVENYHIGVGLKSEVCSGSH